MPVVSAGCTQAREEESSETSDIVAGRIETGYPAVGYLLAGTLPNAPSGPSCGVTLIAENAVVTAAHCIRGHDVFAVSFGIVGSQPILPVTRVIVHPLAAPNQPRHDVAVLRLARSPGITPMPVVAPLVGDRGVAIGYGRVLGGPKGPGPWGERKSHSLVVTFQDELNIETRGIDGGTCYGDSGGPLVIGDGVAGVVWGSPPAEDTECRIESRRLYASLVGEDAFLDVALAEAQD
jgi:hypothetical protein